LFGKAKNLKLTSSSEIKRFSDKSLARVVQISTGANLPEEATLPKARQGTTRRNVLLKRGSS